MKFTLSPLSAAVLAASLAPLAAQAVEVPIRADAYYSLEAGETGVSYGTGANMVANSSSRKALIKFKPLSQFLPSGATSSAKIDKAILHIFVTKTTDNTAKFVISRLDQDWLESSVTGDTAPVVAASPATYTEPVTVTGPALWYNLDVTNIVKYWLDHPSEPRGIMLQTTVGEVEIDSKENTATSHMAHLDISLTNGGGTVTNVSGTGPLSVADGTTTPAISIAQAGNATDGYLSSNDWNIFNNKGNGTVTNVTGSAPISVATGTTTPAITISQAGAASDGYLSSTDWNTFNGKGSVSDVTGSGPISVATGTTTPAITISQAGAASDGYLSSTDWNTFNGKGDGTVTNVTGSGPISVATGTTTPAITISQASSNTDGYLSAADWVLFNSKLSANGDGSSLTGITGSQISGNIAGNAGTATNLAANGSDCGAGNYPLGVDAAGNAESCTPAATGTITGVTAGTGLTGGGISGNVTLSIDSVPGSSVIGNISGNAATATTATTATTSSALAANGSNCSAGQFPLGVDAQGNAESCTTAGTGTITGVTAGTGMTGGGSSGSVTLGIANGGVTSTQIADGSITSSDMTSTGVAAGTYTSANITVDAQGRIVAASTGSGGGSVFNNQYAVVSTQTTAAGTFFMSGTGLNTAGAATEGDGHRIVGSSCGTVKLSSVMTTAPTTGTYTITVRKGTRSGSAYTYSTIGSCVLNSSTTQCTQSISSSLNALDTLGLQLNFTAQFSTNGGAALLANLVCQ